MTAIPVNCVHIIDDFIDESLLSDVANIISNSAHRDNVSQAKGEGNYRVLGFRENMFDSITRYSPPSIILEENNNFPIRQTFDPLMLKMQNTIQDLWSSEVFFETNYSILGYRVGESLKAHHDDIYNLQTNSGHPKRDISSVLYLNDDYVGGELCFVKQRIKIKPKAGTVVLFPSSEKFTHYTNRVISGIKFFIPSLWCLK